MASRLWRLVSEQTPQFTLFIGLSAIALVLAWIASAMDRSSFQRFFGRFHPLAVVALVSGLGLILFLLLLPGGRFAVYRPGSLRGVLLAAGLAVPFAAVMILIDRRFPFPADINIAYPASLSFYPSIAFVVEVLFHLLPFTLVYFLSVNLLKDPGSARILWATVLVTALFEPAFQIIFTSGQSPWVLAYLGLHLFLTNLVQLLLFSRYDFIAMLAFRLSYYMLWHIVWGHLRLGLLF